MFSTSIIEVVADRAVDRVGAAAGRLEHLVEGVVDDIGVVAAAAVHDVAAGAAVEAVGPRLPVMMLARALPVPVMLPVPVRTSLSSSAPSV